MIASQDEMRYLLMAALASRLHEGETLDDTSFVLPNGQRGISCVLSRNGVPKMHHVCIGFVVLWEDRVIRVARTIDADVTSRDFDIYQGPAPVADVILDVLRTGKPL